MSRENGGKSPKSTDRVHPDARRLLSTRPTRAMGLPKVAGLPRLHARTAGGAVGPDASIEGGMASDTQGRQDSCAAPIPSDGGSAQLPALTPVVGRDSGGLEPRTSQVPTVAPDMPLDVLGAGVRTILRRAAPSAAAVLFETINRLKRLARDTEDENLYEESILAANYTGRLAIKTIEMTIGKSLNVHATVQNQTGVPKWESLPPDVREKFLEALAQSPSKVIDTTAEEVEEDES